MAQRMARSIDGKEVPVINRNKNGEIVDKLVLPAGNPAYEFMARLVRGWEEDAERQRDCDGVQKI